MTNLFLINFGLDTISSLEMGIIAAIVAIILIAIILYVYNYRCQLRVFLYMDTQGSVYNRKGLEIYLKRNKKKLKNTTLMVVNINNLSNLYDDYENKNVLVTTICDLLLQGMTKKETLSRIEFGKYICLYTENEREKLKENCKRLEEKFNSYNIPEYGLFNFDMSFGIYDNCDLKKPKVAIDRTIETPNYSIIKDGNIWFYSKEVDQYILRNETINKEKYNALKEGRFVPYVQPKVDFRTGKIIGGEILTRWINENNEIEYFPDDFINSFEKSGFIKEIDLLMFRNACSLVKSLVNNGYPDTIISVNISAITFNQSNFADTIFQITTELGVNPKNIEIEITESTYMKDYTLSSRYINELKIKGFNVAMDDFGQDYSSLGNLSNIPCNTIKLDRVFFKNSLCTDKSKEIVQNIITMLKKLNFNIVCEGIENQATLDILSQINRDIIIQGYCYSQPLSMIDFEAFVSKVFPMEYAEIIDYKKEVEVKTEEVNTANTEIESLKKQMDEMKDLFAKNLEEQRLQTQRQLELEAKRQEDMLRQAQLQSEVLKQSQLQNSQNNNNTSTDDDELMQARLQTEALRQAQIEAMMNRDYQDNRRYRYDDYDDMYYHKRELSRLEDEKDKIARELEELKKAKSDAEKAELEAKLENERRERELLLERLEKLENQKKNEDNDIDEPIVVEPQVVEEVKEEVIEPEMFVEPVTETETASQINDNETLEEDEDEIEDTFVDSELQKQIDSKIDAEQFQELLKQYLNTYKGTESNEEETEATKSLPTIERLNMASKEVKSYYNMLKNAIMEYDGVTNKFTGRYDVFKNGKTVIFKITYVGKTLKIFLPLDPNAYPPARFHHKDVSNVLTHKKTPCMMKVKSDLGLKKALILINDAMITLGLQKNPNYKNANYIARNRFAIQKKNGNY